MINDLVKVQKYEIKFVEKVQKIFLRKNEWSLKEFKTIYDDFIKFCKNIDSKPISLLSVAEVQLRDNDNTLAKILKWNDEEARWYLLNILADEEIHIAMKIALIGAICKLIVEERK